MNISLRRTLRLIALTLLVGGLAMYWLPDAHAAAPCSAVATAQAVLVSHHAAADPSSHQNAPGGLSHKADCCIAGTCASSAIQASGSPALPPLPARSFIYALRAIIEPTGIEAIPSTHPPKATV